MAEEQQLDDRSFFGRLKKLFATNAIVTVDKDGKRKVVDTEDRQHNTNFVNLRDRYTKLQRSYYETNQGAQSMAYHQLAFLKLRSFLYFENLEIKKHRALPDVSLFQEFFFALTNPQTQSVGNF